MCSMQLELLLLVYCTIHVGHLASEFHLNGTLTLNEMNLSLDLSVSFVNFCLVNWGDSFGSSLQVPNRIDHHVIEHTFYQAGSSITYSYCSSETGTLVFKSHNFYAGYRISGLDITDGLNETILAAPNAITDGYNMSVNIQRGSDINISVSINSTGMELNLYQPSGGTKEVNLNADIFNSPGLYIVDVGANNPLGTVEAGVLLAVEDRIAGLQLGSHIGETLFVEYNTTNQLLLSFKQIASGVRLILEYSNSSGHVIDRIGTRCEGPVSSLAVPYTPMWLGSADLKVYAFNRISSEMVQMPLFSEFKLNGFRVNISDQNSFFFNDVTFAVVVLPNASMPIGLVNITVDFGDYNDRVPVKSSINLAGFSLDGIEGLTKKFVHGYSEADNYTFSITFGNELGSYNETHIIVIENQVDGMIGMNHSGIILPRTRPYLNVTIFLTETAKPFKHLLCIFDYSDRTENVIIAAELNHTHNITHQHRYTNLRKKEFVSNFLVKVDCFNSLDNASLSSPVEVYTDCFASNELFTPKRTEESPIKWLTTDILDVKASVQLTGFCETEAPEFVWTASIVSEGQITKSLPEVNSVAISIPAETFYPGLYRLQFNGTYPGIDGRGKTVVDTLVINVSLPDISVSIAGSSEFSVSIEESYHTFNASLSDDPVKALNVCNPLITPHVVNMSESDNATLKTVNKSQENAYECDGAIHSMWTCRQVKSSENADQQVSSAIATFPNEKFINTLDECTDMDLHSEQTDSKLLKVRLSQLQTDYWYVLNFTLTHAMRSGSAVSAMKVVTGNPLVVTIRCLGENCPSSNVKKIKAAALQLNGQVEDNIADKDLIYSWTLFEANNDTDITPDIARLSATGLNQKGLSVHDDSLQKGTVYKIVLNVETVENYRPKRSGRSTLYLTTNFEPYGGTCTVDNTTGVATEDLFLVECLGWKDEGTRIQRNEEEDKDPNLQYIVYQNTPGAFVPLETVFKSFSARMMVALKIGSPELHFTTYLIVRVSDQYDYVETNITLTVKSQLNSNASPGDIEEFMGKSLDDLKEGEELGDDSLTLVLTSSIASQISVVNVSVEEEKVSADVSKTQGGLIDMPNLGRPLNFTEMLAELQPTEQPAIVVTVQEAVVNLSVRVDNVVKDASKNGRISSELVQQLSANMAGMFGSKYSNANNQTKQIVTSSLLQLAEIVHNDSSPGKLASLKALQDLCSPLIKSVIPKNLKNRQPIRNVEYLRAIIAGLQDTGDTNLDEAEITNEEREYNYRRLQDILEYEVEQEKPHARETAKGLLSVAQKTLLRTNLCSGCSKDLNTDHFKEKIEVDNSQRLAEKEITTPSNTSKVKLKGLPSEQQSIAVALSTFSDNIFFYDDDGKSSYVTSAVGHVDVMTPDGKFMTLPEFSFKQPTTTTPIPTKIIPLIYEEDASKLSAHKVFIRNADDHFCILLRPFDQRIIKYTAYLKKSKRPSIIDFDAKQEASPASMWTACFYPEMLQGHIGTAYLGVKAESEEVDHNRRQKRASNPSENQQNDPVYSYYNFSAVTLGCMLWESDCECWKADKCDVTWLPVESEVLCDCKNVKEMTFANSFYVAPNSIDFSTVFLKFSPLNQAAVLSVITFMAVLYGVLLIWARRQDQRDVLRWGITSLSDNFPDDNYFYILRVHTGLRPSAGTKSRIYFVITGEEEDTGIRELCDGVRRYFPSGSVLNFLMSTPRPLGQLLYLRVWHDNSGGGDYASWYLSKVDIQDIQCRQNVTFLSEKWLAVDKDDCSLDCVIPPAPKENLATFRNRMYYRTKENLAESHMWVSVLYRPVTSCFTRVQRVSCAFVFLMLSMFVNARYYNPADNYENPSVVKIGPFIFTLQQCYISIVSALITTPSTLLIIVIFRNYKREFQPDEDILENMNKNTKQTSTPGPSCLKSWFAKMQKESIELEKQLVATGLPRYQKYILANWLKYVAWFMVVAGIAVPAFIVLLYSMEWGKQKSEEWLTSYLLTWLESILCFDPCKVVLMAFLYAVMCRSMENEAIRIDRSVIVSRTAADVGHTRLPAPPLSEAKLEKAKQERAVEQKMKTTFWSIMLNTIFLWIIASISYSNRDAMSFYLHREITNTILEPTSTNSTFSKISSTESFYDWLNDTVFEKLYPDKNSNGDTLPWRSRQFTSGYTNFRLGPPRLRQLRTKREHCLKTRLSSEYCYREYEGTKEETGSYCLGWKDPPCTTAEVAYKYSSDAWKFTSAIDTWGYPLTGQYVTYNGGGYIANLAVNSDLSKKVLQELRGELWIDRQTRAVFMESTLYNINLNIFIYNILLVEFPETGGVVSFYWLKPLRLYQHVGSFGLYILGCEVLLLVFILGNTIYITGRICQQRMKFFRSGWQIMDMFGLLISYMAIGLYFVRYFLTGLTVEKFNKDRKKFVDFAHVVAADDALIALIGCLSFFVTLRFVNILGISKRMYSIVLVFANAAADMFWFGLLFAVMYVFYACFGFLLFGSTLENYKNVYKTLGTLFISMIGKSRFTEIDSTDPIMAKIYFMAFILFMVYLMLTLFLSLLTGSIDQVRREEKEGQGEELLGYMLTKLKRFFGWRMTEETKQDDRKIPNVWDRKFDRKLSLDDNKRVLMELRNAFVELDVVKYNTSAWSHRHMKRIRFNKS